MRCFWWCCTFSMLLIGCGADDVAGCVELREPEDQASGQHVLTEGAVEYQTNPPTSGPHIAGPTPEGALDVPVAPAIQVRLLEAGGVMVQYDQSLDEAEVAQLVDVASSTIVVAPAGDDLPARVVATAWTWKLTCNEVDTDRIGVFSAGRVSEAPGLD